MAYKAGTSTCLGLQIPREAGVNREEVAAYEERQLKRQQLKEQGGSDAAEGQVGGWVGLGEGSEWRLATRAGGAGCMHARASARCRRRHPLGGSRGGKGRTRPRPAAPAALPARGRVWVLR